MKTFSILIIGVGGIGERHLRCFQATGRTRVAICEPNAERRAMIARQYSATEYATVTEALAAEKFDGAVICTPAPSHPGLAEQCLNAGLAVLVEKPLSASRDGIDSLQQSLDRTKGVLRIAYVYRSIPVIRAGRELVQAGSFGPIRHVSVELGQNFPLFRPDFKNIYYAKRSAGGGAIQDSLTHVIHAVEWTVGPVTELACMAAQQVLTGVDVEDTANLICLHRDGTLSSFAINQFQAPNEVRISYHAPGGSVRIELRRQALGLMRQTQTDWEWQSVPHGDRDTMFTTQANAFLNAAAGLPEDLCDLAAARQTLEVNLGALASSDSRLFVRIAS